MLIFNCFHFQSDNSVWVYELNRLKSGNSPQLLQNEFFEDRVSVFVDVDGMSAVNQGLNLTGF